MQRGLVIAIFVLLLAPGAFASEAAPREPRFNLPKIVRRLLGKITMLDEILTGTKP